jgi:signal peptidase II
LHNLKRISALTWLWLSALVFVLDQLSKQWVLKHLMLGGVTRWCGFFNLRLAYNPGAAFSFLGDASGWQRGFLAALTIVILIMLVEWLRRAGHRSTLFSASLSLIIGGAVGNLVDRIRLGYVIDFFDFHISDWHFATFNVADSAISVGVILLLVCMLLKRI